MTRLYRRLFFSPGVIIVAAITLHLLTDFAGAQQKPGAAGMGPSFKGPLALQLYSLRAEFKRDGVPKTLARVREFGFTNVELGGSYDLTPQQFKAELDKAGLKPVSMHASFDDLRDKIDKVIGDAKVYGVEWVGCAWIPHKGAYTAQNNADAALVFNAAGEKLSAAGFKFMYHAHGYEFGPSGAGGGETLFDALVAATKPGLVNFQLDIFWAYHGGADPAKLLEKYPQRFGLLHLKDMRAGTERNLTGHAPDDTSVALGTGVIDMKGVLRAARKAGVKWYVVEEESPEPHLNIPAGLRYLEQVKY